MGLNADWLKFDAYLFDIDGTLLHARDGVHMNAMSEAMRVVWGSTRPLEEVPIHGNTDIGILRGVAELDGIPEDEFEVKLPQAIDIMRRSIKVNKSQAHPFLCPSIRELLELLQRRNKLMGVSTGNIAEAAALKLQATGIDEFFSFGSYSDEHERREDIFGWAAAQARERLGSAAKVLFFGDTPNDVRAANFIGEPVVAVATGRFSREQLLSSGHSHLCLESCEALVNPSLPFSSEAV